MELGLMSVWRWWGSCKDDDTWNPNMCDCECNKACKTGEY